MPTPTLPAVGQTVALMGLLAWLESAGDLGPRHPDRFTLAEFADRHPGIALKAERDLTGATTFHLEVPPGHPQPIGWSAVRAYFGLAEDDELGRVFKVDEGRPADFLAATTGFDRAATAKAIRRLFERRAERSHGPGVDRHYSGEEAAALRTMLRFGIAAFASKAFADEERREWNLNALLLEGSLARGDRGTPAAAERSPLPPGFAPIECRGFHDVPLRFRVKHAGDTLLFDRAFDDVVGEYADHYTVRYLPAELAALPIEAYHDSVRVGHERVAEELRPAIGSLPFTTVPVADVTFDETRRAGVHADVLGRVTGPEWVWATPTLSADRIASSVDDLVAHVHEGNAKWWVDPHTGLPLDRNVGEMLMLIVSELAEAMEGHRKGLPDDHLPHRSMLEVELADAMIRILDVSAGLKLDLGGAVAEKLGYNRTRADHTRESRLAEGGKKY